MFKLIIAIIQRDLRIYMCNKGEWASTLLFFVIICCLFPMALGQDQEKLIWMGPGIIWVAALLASLLSLESLFRAELQAGVFEQCLVSPYPLPLLITGKMFAHWLANGLPLVIVAPILGSFFSLPSSINFILFITLLLGTPSLSLVGQIGVALTASLPRGGMLLAILILPLYLPILILGTVIITISSEGLPVIGHLAILSAIAITALALAPVAVAGALTVSTT
jgi:heme exporter protein B